LDTEAQDITGTDHGVSLNVGDVSRGFWLGSRWHRFAQKVAQKDIPRLSKAGWLRH
jgi:hypothetical protein